jgi:hypothetical protein
VWARRVTRSVMVDEQPIVKKTPALHYVLG